ncbi:hypothetical protein PN498_06600 [Oscillatoria sp. CS-180]|uniref:hypothetical protein n=1 Tax=Oscillatoria sp. CS-180 TaxID=3021720 RepID=UPI0023310327|nr:hypothetical protein [Oscillatoria sp. CS-180]MDB9525651.1 hypothetical protein [Oscillatoria sp. CS-180]
MTDKIFPIALRLWLLFLLTFLVLGYTIPTSIILGAIGGFAGGTVSAWWQTPGGEPKEEELEPTALDKLADRLRTPQVRTRLPFLKLFTRRDRRHPGSRRL